MRCNGTLASGETSDTNCGVSSTIPFTLIAMVKYRTQNLFLQKKKKKKALPIILAQMSIHSLYMPSLLYLTHLLNLEPAAWALQF